VILVVFPEQIEGDVDATNTVGVGFTVTVKVVGVPEQPLAVGVMVYTAVPEEELVAVKFWEMEDPDPAVAPLTFV
jgi:hypothetical protein